LQRTRADVQRQPQQRRREEKKIDSCMKTFDAAAAAACTRLYALCPVSTIPLPFFRCRFRTPLPLPLPLPLRIFLPFTAVTERNFSYAIFTEQRNFTTAEHKR